MKRTLVAAATVAAFLGQEVVGVWALAYEPGVRTPGSLHVTV